MDNSSAKAYLCNQGGTAFCFLSRLACHILNLADKHGIPLIPTYIPTHLNVEADYLSGGSVGSWVAPASLNSSGSISPLGWTSGGSIVILMYQSMSVLLFLGKSTSSGYLGVECFQQPLDKSGKLWVSSFYFSAPGAAIVPGTVCHRSFPTSYSSGTLLDWGSWVSHRSQHVWRHSSTVSYFKGPHHVCLSQPCVQGSAVTAFNPLTAQRCVLCRQGFSSICEAVVGVSWEPMTKV